MSKMKLGILGMSEGNGHPYSWSAIINGYKKETMADCPFAAIPGYLALRSFPSEFLCDIAEVTHVWTQDRQVSEHIAGASLIPNVVDDFADMAGHVDAVLLARDDARNHRKFAEVFLRKGLPIYIDKPLALNVKSAVDLYALESWPGQIFSCSALRFAKEFQLSTDNNHDLGEIISIEAFTPKYWNTYSVHIIDPVLRMLNYNVSIARREVKREATRTIVYLWLTDGKRITLTSDSASHDPISVTVNGVGGARKMIFEDSFFAFRAALREFILGAKSRTSSVTKEQNLLTVSIIEMGALD